MQYLALRRLLNDFLVFSLADIRKVAPDFDLRRISEWLSRGLIKRVRRGFYVFAETSLNDEALFAIAGRIYAPAYISYESALARYGLIPEAVYAITSATSLKTARFKTPFGLFVYQSLQPELFWGYHIEGQGNRTYKLADPEKAVLDYLYQRPGIKSLTDLAASRLNVSEAKLQLDRSKFLDYLGRFDNQALVKRAHNLLNYLDHAQHSGN